MGPKKNFWVKKNFWTMIRKFHTFYTFYTCKTHNVLCKTISGMPFTIPVISSWIWTNILHLTHCDTRAIQLNWKSSRKAEELCFSLKTFIGWFLIYAFEISLKFCKFLQLLDILSAVKFYLSWFIKSLSQKFESFRI